MEHAWTHTVAITQALLLLLVAVALVVAPPHVFPNSPPLLTVRIPPLLTHPLLRTPPALVVSVARLRRRVALALSYAAAAEHSWLLHSPSCVKALPSRPNEASREHTV